MKKEIEVRFVVLALPGYHGVCVMIAKFFVYFELQNDDCALPEASGREMDVQIHITYITLVFYRTLSPLAPLL